MSRWDQDDDARDLDSPEAPAPSPELQREPPAIGKRTLIQEMQERGAAPPSHPGKRTLTESMRPAAGEQFPFQNEIQRLLGRHSIAGTKASVGGAAADTADALDANAYTHGDQVAFWRTPDLRLAAHEAAHVVQQRKGHAPDDGIDSPDDVLERHADAVADRVVAGELAEPLLDALPDRGAPAAAIQRDSKGKDKGPVGPTNPEYVNKYAVSIIRAIADRIAVINIPQPHPRVHWTTLDEAVQSIGSAITLSTSRAVALRYRRVRLRTRSSRTSRIVSSASTRQT